MNCQRKKPFQYCYYTQQQALAVYVEIRSELIAVHSYQFVSTRLCSDTVHVCSVKTAKDSVHRSRQAVRARKRITPGVASPGHFESKEYFSYKILAITVVGENDEVTACCVS